MRRPSGNTSKALLCKLAHKWTVIKPAECVLLKDRVRWPISLIPIDSAFNGFVINATTTLTSTSQESDTHARLSYPYCSLSLSLSIVFHSLSAKLAHKCAEFECLCKTDACDPLKSVSKKSRENLCPLACRLACQQQDNGFDGYMRCCCAMSKRAQK